MATAPEIEFLQSMKPIVIFECEVSAPPNIAFVKYWGKFGEQKPINPSLSMTLTYAKTQTLMKVSKSDVFGVDVLFEGERHLGFKKRIESYFQTLIRYYPELSEYHYHIETSNNFAHSTGIASSASGFAALGSCLGYFLESLGRENISKSELARLGSGSASRSIMGPFMIWGTTTLKGESSDLEAIPMNPGAMEELGDIIVIINEEPKEISSSMGHSLMESHPYKNARIQNAHRNILKVYKAFRDNDFELLGNVIESEALELHALMMTSATPFWLILPETLSVMNWVKEMRAKGEAVYFTLDAGANIHLITKLKDQRVIAEKFKERFSELKILLDRQGLGIERIR